MMKPHRMQKQGNSKNNTEKNKIQEKYLKIFIFSYPLIAAAASLLLNANFLISILIFLGFPSLVLSLKSKHLVKKTAFFSAILTPPLTIIVDYIAQITRTWDVQTVFPRLFGVIVIEQFIMVFLWTYFVIMYYEHFLAHKIKDRLYYPHIKYIALLFYALLLGFFIVLVAKPEILSIKYFYLKIGLLVALPPIVFAAFKLPNIWTKLLKAAAYFFYFSFIYEVTALQLGQWNFPSTQFIGWVSIGSIRFPLEELIFWILLGALTTLSYYEFFDDKQG